MPIKDVQTTNRQHAVPQNIMDVEFKIIGELTMRQFFYLLIFGGVAYILSVGIQGFLKWPLVVLFALLGLALAFLPIEERGLDQWIINFFKTIYTDNQRIWHKEPQTLSAFMYQNLNVVKQELITLAPTASRRKLEEFLNEQDKKKDLDPMDILEEQYIKKVRTALKPKPAPVTTATPAAVPTTTVKQPFVKKQIPIPTATTVLAATPPTRVQKQQTQEIQKPPMTSTTQRTLPPKLSQKIKPEKEQVKKVKPKEPEITKPTPTKQLAALTPDQHSGRVFTNLLPSQGEIVLPIRGEKVLKTSEETDIETDIQEKTQQLKELLKRIKKDEGISVLQSTEVPQTQVVPQTQPAQQPSPKVQTLPQQDSINQQIKDTLKQLQEENQTLTNRISTLQQELQSPDSKQEKTTKLSELQELQKERTETTKDYTTVKEHLANLQEKVLVRRAITPDYTQKEKTQALPQERSNTLFGKVMDQQDKGLENVVLIIKNAKNEPVRALKTDNLGNFVISTPLTSGTYTVETDKTNKSGLTFDTIKVEAVGQTIPQLAIKGHSGAL